MDIEPIIAKGTRLLVIIALPFFLNSCRSKKHISFFEHLPMTLHPGSFRGPVIFEGPVKDILQHRCIHCHNNKSPNGGLNLQDRKVVFSGDENGPFLVPGEPDKSRIWDALLRPTDHPQMMPADGWGLTLYEMQAFRSWIEQGAHWPEGEDGQLEVKPYALQATKPL